METYFYNLRGNQKIPFFLDFPVDTIKNNIWYHSLLLIGEKDSMRFIPPFVRLLIVHNRKEYKVETYKEYIVINKRNEILNISKDKKIIITDGNKKFIWYNDSKYYLNSDNDNIKPYKPEHLYEILDLHRIELQNAQFMYESLVDVIQSEPNISYEQVIKDWPFITLDDFNLARQFLQKFDNNWYQAYLRSNLDNNLQKFWSDYNNIRPLLTSNKYLINEEIIQTQIVISKGDEFNNYISLERIFKSFETSLEVPFISVKISGSTRIKLDSQFSDMERIKDWTLGEGARNKKVDELNEENLRLIEPKGLTFKIKITKDSYATANLYSNGRMTLRCFKNKESLKINCPLLVKKIVKTINQIPEAFIHEPRKIELKEETNSFFNIDLTYKNYFDINDFEELNYKFPFIREYVFSDLFYELSSTNFISLVKKTITEKSESSGLPKGNGYFSRNNYYDDFKMMIKRSFSFENASSIQILGINSYSQLESIKFWLNICFNLANKTIDVQNEKRVNKNKELKETEVIFDARKCQGERQPRIFKLDSTENEWKPLVKKGAYDLVYKNNRIVCNSDQYPYPGFTSSGHVCCFKTDQRKNEKFLKNFLPQENFLVQPINLFYTSNKNKYLVVYKNGDYFYIKDKNLIPLPEKNTQNLIKKEQEANEANRTYFSREISYNNLLMNIDSNKQIQITKEGSLVCSSGFVLRVSEEGQVKCYSKETKHEPTYYKDKFKSVSLTHHIITTDKVLPVKRIGVLPSGIQKIFDNLNLPEIKFYRMGVNQGSDSFLEAISVNTDKSVQEIHKIINQKLTYNLFLSLENGELAFLFGKNFKNFKSFLKDSKENKSYIHYWDLIQYLLDIQIIILDYFEQSIICHKKSHVLNLNKKTIFVIKFENNYEPIIAINNFGIIKNIDMKENSIVKKFYDFVCDPIPKINLKDVRYQIIDSAKNKVLFLVTKDNFFIPINELINYSSGPIAGLEIRSLNKRKPTAEKMFQLSKKYGVEIEGQILNSENSKNQEVIGLLTKKFTVIPVKNSPVIKDVPISDYNYFPDAEKSLSKSSKPDSRIKFINYKHQIELMYHLLKYKYSIEYVKSDRKLSVKTFFSQFVLWENMSDDLFNNLDIKVSDCSNNCVNICIKNSEGICLIRARATFKDYFIQRLETEVKTNPYIKAGQISSKYEEIPENQIIFNEVSKVIQYLKTLKQ